MSEPHSSLRMHGGHRFPAEGIASDRLRTHHDHCFGSNGASRFLGFFGCRGNIFSWPLVRSFPRPWITCFARPEWRQEMESVSYCGRRATARR